MAAQTNELLPFRNLYALAYAVAKAHRLSLPSGNHLRLRYDDKEPVSTVMVNENGTLWVDREYIAYSLADGSIHYVYVTRAHVRDEIASYAVLRNGRDKRANPVRLPPEILSQYALAQRTMDLHDSTIFLSEEARLLATSNVKKKRKDAKLA